MTRGWWFKVILIVVVTVTGVMINLPTLAGRASLPDWFNDTFKNTLKQGLDLQGGIHLVLEVEVDKALQDMRDRTLSDMERRAKDKEAPVTKSYLDPQDEKMLVFETDHMDKFIKLLEDDTRLTIFEKSEKKVIVGFVEEYEVRIKDLAVEQAIKTIRNRIDEYGVSEPSIARRGLTGIQIQLPGEADPERAKDLLGKTAQLEFKMVRDGVPYFKDLTLPAGSSLKLQTETVSGKGGSVLTSDYLIADTKAELLKFLGTQKAPQGWEFAISSFNENMVEKYRSYLVEDRSVLTGEYLTDASVQINQDINQPYVGLTFNPAGAEIFSDLTGKNVGKRMAILLDNIVDSAPVINEKISGGRAQITLGGFKGYQQLLDDANDLAVVLRAGALPAPVRIEEERTVGPTLGKDSIEQGKMSIIVGFSLTFIFMAFYYRGSGVIADFSLLLNIVFILAALTSFNATLTLPGIAGIVLTMGMAVDANVIIFERIREEINSGKSPRASVEIGFAKAITAILDANITTFIAGVVLYQYGSGPIKGFAVTLMIGIVTSLFSAVFVSRTLYEYFIDKMRVKSISI